MVYREVVAHVAVAQEGHWACPSPLRGPFLRSRVPPSGAPQTGLPQAHFCWSISIHRISPLTPLSQARGVLFCDERTRPWLIRGGVV